MKGLAGINLLNISFLGVEMWVDKIPVIVSVLVGLSILTLNVIRIIKALKK